MRPLRDRLQRLQSQLKVPWEVLERDYVLSWVLGGLVTAEGLSQSLIFKGGTALKKCYFGDYRFSEDLDFSSVDLPVGAELDSAVKRACELAIRLAQPYAPLELQYERYVEKKPHPEGQEAYIVRARLPWHREPRTRVIIEITRAETVLMPVALRPLLHGYEEPVDIEVPVYSLEEVVMEKLRGILQHREAMRARGWIRSRARDYYDLWRILGTYQDSLDLVAVRGSLPAKCAARGVGFESADDFFDEAMLRFVEKTWKDWLGPLVPQLPAYVQVLGELRPQVEALLTR